MWNNFCSQHRYLGAADWNPWYENLIEQSLTQRERLELERYRNQQRRTDWLRGRYVAKQLIDEICCQSQDDWSRISILSRNEQGEAVAPLVVIDGIVQSVSLSISHTTLGVWVGLCTDSSLRLGVDLTVVEQFSDSFVKTWLQAIEQDILETVSNRNQAIATIWAIKEAAYKACQTGEAFQPQRCLVRQNSQGNYECWYRQGTGYQETTIQTQTIERQVVAIATAASNLEVSTVSSMAGTGGKQH